MSARLSAGGPGRAIPAGARSAWSDLIGLRCGLALRDAQIPVLTELVQERVRARGLAHASDYFDLLAAEADGGPEWTDLMERLVSHETSFFRHRPTFDAIRTCVVPELGARKHAGAHTLTFWSAGCSTGQEAYSLAMTVTDDGGAAGPFTVWGTDISPRAIEAARRGRYSDRAMGSIPYAYRRRFFRAFDDSGARRYEVVDELRRRVRFVSANLYTACAMLLGYDVIVCQNVLIYFAQTAVSTVVSMLAGRLNPGGYLLLGPGEWPGDCPAGLEAITLNGVRAFRRVGRTSGEVRS